MNVTYLILIKKLCKISEIAIDVEEIRRKKMSKKITASLFFNKITKLFAKKASYII